MKILSQKNSHQYIRSDFQTLEESLAQGTHLAVGAHPDDLEVMAGHGILECLANKEFSFIGVTCCTGSGCVRGESFRGFNEQQMMELRREEQVQAAVKGDYAAVLQLGYESSQIKGKINSQFVAELKKIIEKTQPKVIYTHNLMDKHQTHISVAVHVVEALRELNYQPTAFYGCEVWRGLDWIADEKKIILPILQPKCIAELISLHKSQTESGKDYAQASVGRMQANATFFDATQVDQCTHSWLAIDMLPLVNKKISYNEFVNSYLERLQKESLQALRVFERGCE